MGLLDNGGRELGQWPPFPLKHFQEKWNPLFRQKMLPSQRNIFRKSLPPPTGPAEGRPDDKLRRGWNPLFRQKMLPSQ
jgi:hypothetical protein